MRDDWPFGVELARRRTEAGLSYRQLQEKSGISYNKIKQLETGTVSLGGGRRVRTGTRASTVTKVADALGWPVPEALELAGFDESGRPVDLEPDPGVDEPPPDLRTVDELALVDELRRRIARRSDGAGGTVTRLRPSVEKPDDAQRPAGEGSRWAARRRPPSGPNDHGPATE